MNTAVRQTNSARDFPTFVPPLLVKELRQGLRTRGFVFFLVLFPLLMSLPFLIYFMVGAGVIEKEMINVFFWGCVMLFFLVLNPLRTLSAVSMEKATRSGELIAMTSLSSSRIVWGKWIAYALQTFLLALVIMPFMLLRYFLGGVELLSELIALSAIFVLALVQMSFGVWLSGMPVVYRILFVLGILQSVMGVPFMFLGGGSVSIFRGIGTDPGLLFLTFAIFAGVLFFLCRSVLVLSSRWFAAPSENIAYDFRRNILWMTLVVVGGDFLLWAVSSGMNDVSTALFSLNIFYYICLTGAFIVDMSFSQEILPIHVRKIEEGGDCSRLSKKLWLPGWQSAGLFYLILMLVFCCAFMFLLWHEGDGTIRDGEKLVRGVFLVWADVALLAFALQALWKKLGVHSLAVFPLLMVVLFVMAALFKAGGEYDMSVLIGFVPGGNLLTLNSDTAEVQGLNWIFVFLVFVGSLVASVPYWKKCREYSGKVSRGRERDDILETAGRGGDIV